MKIKALIIASASTIAIANTSTTDLITKRNGVELQAGYVSESWEYIENNSQTGKQIMKDSGTLTGFELSASKIISESSKLQLIYKTVKGDTDYEGGLQWTSGGQIFTAPYNTKSKNSIDTLKLQLESQLTSGSNQKLKGTLGYQVRTLKNPELASDPYDYTREATYNTVPVGLKYQLEYEKVNLSFNLEYHALFSGETFTKSSDVGGTDKTYKQNNGSGLKLSADIRWKTSKNYNVVITPYIETWDVEDSEFVQQDENFVSLEPKNETKTTGVNISIAI